MAWRFRAGAHFGQLHDDGVYLGCAKSLATGQGYRILSLPGAPFQTKYPPLYPAYLSLVWHGGLGFPENLPYAILLQWLLLPMLCVLAGLLWRQIGVTPWIAAAVPVMLACNHYSAFLGTVLMSDLLLTVLMLAALLAAERKQAATAGLLAVAAVLTGTRCLGLGLTIPALYLWRRDRQRAARFIAVFWPIATAWFLWAALHTVKTTDGATVYQTSYLGEFRQAVTPEMVWQLIVRNSGLLIASISQSLLADLATSVVGSFLIPGLALAMIIGTVRLTRRYGLGHYQTLAILYMLPPLFWPSPLSWRYTYPLLPLLWAGLLFEIGQFATKIRDAMRTGNASNRRAAWGLATLLAAAGVWSTRAIAHSTLVMMPSVLTDTEKASAGDPEAFAWIRQNLPADALLLTWHDPLVYLATGHQALRPPLPETALTSNQGTDFGRILRDWADESRRVHATHLFLKASDFNQPDALDLIQKHASELPGLTLLRRTAHDSVYAVSATADPASAIALPAK